MPAPFYLITNSTTNGTSSYITIDEGGRFLLEAEGTWGGATLTFVYTGAQKNNAIAVTDAFGSSLSFTADGAKRVDIPKGTKIAVTQTNSTGSTTLSVTLKRIGDE